AVSLARRRMPCATVMFWQPHDMAERILPQPDAFATAPPADVSILEHYAGIFEAVYVLLHPFIDAAEVRTEQFKPGTYPNRKFIAANCRAVSWADIIERTGLPSIAAVDVGLRTGIHGLKAEFSNQEYAAKIESLIES